MRDLFVLGSSGLAREVAQLAELLNRIRPTWKLCGYIAESEDEVGRALSYGKVVGTDDWLLRTRPDADVVLGVGHPAARRKIAERFRGVQELRWPNLIHPTAAVDLATVQLGIGNVVTHNCVMTCDIAIGDFNHFNWNVTVGQHARIGSYNVINPASNISGFVHLHDEILIGTGAQILEHLTIASRTSVGAGAVVTATIDAEGGTYVGVPAKRRP